MKKYVAQVLTRLKSRGRYSHLSLMKEYEYKSITECRELQKGLLFNILSYTIKNIPYYRDIVKKKDITISRTDIFEDIKKFPILNKEILRNYFDNLKSETFEGNYYKNTSGGSTGEPAVFLQDTSYNEKEKGAKIFFNEWTGRKVGEKMIKLWGSEREILEGSQGIDGWINENILNIKLLNSFRMSESDMRDYVEIINKEKPKIIEAYVQSIYELSKFIKNNNLKVYSSKGIITSAGTLYPEFLKLIEEVFKTKVYNQYGSREAGIMAFSCEKNDGLHLNIFNQYIEILDDKMQPSKAGEIGQVYVTTLNNYVMPLIRFQIEDMAAPAKNEQCSCGRGLPLIEKVVGRTSSLFISECGQKVHSAYFRHLIFFKDWIKQYQIIQKDYNLIVYKIVKNYNYDLKDKEKEEIINRVKKVMGSNCEVKFEFVDNIEPTKSGKYLYTISEVE